LFQSIWHFLAASASRTWFPDHVFQDPGIGEVTEEDNLALPDTEDLDGRRRERLAVVVRVPFARISTITTSGSWV
jgi:hypothetical protein